MKKDFLKGINIGLGIIFIFSILGLVYAVGFHIADEVLSGEFTGDFEFNGSVNFTNAQVSGIGSGITLGTQQAATGTNVTFTGIPSGTKRISIMFEAVSTAGIGDRIVIQLGDSGGFETTSYVSEAWNPDNTAISSTSYFILTEAWNPSLFAQGIIDLRLKNSTSNTWVLSGLLGSSTTAMSINTGYKSLSSELTSIVIKMEEVNPDTFDSGSINIQYE